MTEDKILAWHHQLNGHKFEQAPQDDKGQGSLLCYTPWGRKESDMTDQQVKKALCAFALASARTPFIFKLNYFFQIYQQTLSRFIDHH